MSCCILTIIGLLGINLNHKGIRACTVLLLIVAFLLYQNCMLYPSVTLTANPPALVFRLTLHILSIILWDSCRIMHFLLPQGSEVPACRGNHILANLATVRCPGYERQLSRLTLSGAIITIFSEVSPS